MNSNNKKAWLYLLPALLFLIVFMVYPLIDVFIYSVEEGFNFASQTYFGVGLYNFSYVLHDPYFLQAVQNTFILVIITVPVSTGSDLHRIKFYKASPGALSDCILPSLCDQHPGCRAGFYGAFSEDGIYRRAGKSGDPALRRRIH